MTSNDHRTKRAKRLPHPAKARNSINLTQRALAERIGTTQVTVFRCERDGVYPKHKTLRAAYIAALGLPPEVEVKP